MPRSSWNARDERQYKHILQSCTTRGRYGKKRCRRIAAATVNQTRCAQGRAKRCRSKRR